MLVGVMPEVVGHWCSLMRAVRRDSRPEELGGQQEQEGDKQPATHAGEFNEEIRSPADGRALRNNRIQRVRRISYSYITFL